VQKTWKDDLPWLVFLTIVQFIVLRVVDWAKGVAGQPDHPNAQRLLDHHFYFAPQIIFIVIFVLLWRLVRDALDLRGVQFLEWVKQSALFLFVGLSIIVLVHLDQLFGFLGHTLGIGAFAGMADAFSSGPYALLREHATIRFFVDVCGLLVCLFALRLQAPRDADKDAAKDVSRAGDWIKAGEMYLKVGDLRRARSAFKKANATSRLAALELEHGDPERAAELFEESGPAYAWEAAQAWSAAAREKKAAELRLTALDEARSSARWDRLAEIAAVVGDANAVAEATRRMAELKAPGPERTALWKRAGDAAKAAGRHQEAGESYRAAGEFLLAGESFQQAGKPREAAQDFERGGELARASQAAAAAGDERLSKEFGARDAEARGDMMAAAEAWRGAGNLERAAALFEKKGLFPRAASTWRELGRMDRAAMLYQRAGDQQAAAVAWELAGQNERAAQIYRALGDHERAANLFKGLGKWLDSAADLERVNRYEEASAMYHRAGQGYDAARCALMAGQNDRCWEYLVAVPRNEERTRELFHALAEAHLRKGEMRDAVLVMRELLGPGPVDAKTVRWHHTLARALAGAGDTAEAADRLARINEFDPTYLKESEKQPIHAAIQTRRLAAEQAAAAQAQQPQPPYAPPPPSSGYHPRPPSGVYPMAPSSQSPRPGGLGATPSPMGPLTGGPLTPSRSGPVFGAPTGPVTDASGAFLIGEAPEHRYEVVQELGRGGMGVVHKALDRKLDRYVALKILPWQALADETALRYFAREAKAVAALRHPNVVAIYDYGKGWGSLYIAMEFLDGPNLQTMMKSDPARLKRSWRDWFVQATRGVAAAHAKGILHRDLKPANLMLDEHGTLRILDFGLARPQSDAGGTSKLIGTPAFFPPEVLRGEAPSPASDVYSLGATFYTLATGRWPYVGDDVLIARLEREPDDPHPYAPHLHEDEIDVLMKALARHRPERYPDAGELLGALLSLEA